jgi:hypothetical protein
VLSRFRHQIVPGRRERRALAPLLARDEHSDEMMRRLTTSERFTLDAASKAVEATEKAKTSAG